MAKYGNAEREGRRGGRGRKAWDSYDICTYVHLNSLRRLAFTFFTAFFRLSFLTLPSPSFSQAFFAAFGCKMLPRRVNHKNNIINVTFTWQL